MSEISLVSKAVQVLTYGHHSIPKQVAANCRELALAAASRLDQSVSALADPRVRTVFLDWPLPEPAEKGFVHAFGCYVDRHMQLLEQSVAELESIDERNCRANGHWAYLFYVQVPMIEAFLIIVHSTPVALAA